MIARTLARRPRLAPLVLLLGLGFGCGRDANEIPTYPTSGVVRVGGQPAANALIQFHPVDPATGKPAEGPEVVANTTRSEPDGRYSLSTKWADDGIAAGSYVVTVRPAGAKSSDEGAVDGPPQSAAPAPSKSLAAYADKATSPLKVTVKAEGTSQIDLDVK